MLELQLADHLTRGNITHQCIELPAGLKMFVCRKVYLNVDLPAVAFILVFAEVTKECRVVFIDRPSEDGLMTFWSHLDTDEDIRVFFRKIVEAFPKVEVNA